MEQIDYYQVALKFKYAVAARLQRERSFDIDNISKVTAYLNRLVNDQDEAELFFLMIAMMIYHRYLESGQTPHSP